MQPDFSPAASLGNETERFAVGCVSRFSIVAQVMGDFFLFARAHIAIEFQAYNPDITQSVIFIGNITKGGAIG